MKLAILAFAAGVLISASGAFAISESEVNNDPTVANGPFTLPDTITGLHQNDGSTTLSDFFSFDATSGVQYTFVINGSGFPNPDPGLAIWQDSFTMLVDKDDNGVGGNETLVWTAPSTARFYLEVFEATATPGGSYSVAASSNQTSVDDWMMY